jgi:hypothetical protein
MTRAWIWAALATVTSLGTVGMAAQGAPPAEKEPEKKAPEKKPAPPAPTMAFNPKELDLAPGETYPVELYVPTPTGKTARVTLGYTPGSGLRVQPDSRWTGRVTSAGAKTFPKITAAQDADGTGAVTASLDGGPSAKLSVRIIEPHVDVAADREHLRVTIESPFRSRLLNGRVQASNPDRFLQDITTREFKVVPGQKQVLDFPLDGASPAEGETYDFTLTVQTYQGYSSKRTYTLAFPPQDEK